MHCKRGTVRPGLAARMLAAVFLVLLWCSSSPAQEEAAIRGVVRNQAGAPVAGASVVVSNTSSGLRRETQSDLEGRFEITGLPPDSYNVEISLTGFATQQRPGVRVSGGELVSLQFVLQSESERNQAGRISEAQLAGLPLNGRSYNQLATLQAGIAETPPRRMPLEESAEAASRLPEDGPPPTTSCWTERTSWTPPMKFREAPEGFSWARKQSIRCRCSAAPTGRSMAGAAAAR